MILYRLVRDIFAFICLVSLFVMHGSDLLRELTEAEVNREAVKEAIIFLLIDFAVLAICSNLFIL